MTDRRKITATLPDSSTNEFTYDGDKRRVARKDASGDEKWFLYDGVNILQDISTDGTVWTSYVQGIGIDKLISTSEWAGQTTPEKRYYHSDAIGSVRSLTDDDENQVGTYEYDAWGKVTSETGSSTNEYKFTSRRWEQDLGLQYNRARFYDPEIGRFITPDPLTGGPDDPSISYFSGVYSQFHRFIKEYISALQPDKHNRYVYCYNNPVNLVDPLGLEGTNVEEPDPEPDPSPGPAPATQPTPPPEVSSTPATTQPGETAEDVVTGHDVDKDVEKFQSSPMELTVVQATKYIGEFSDYEETGEALEKHLAEGKIRVSADAKDHVTNVITKTITLLDVTNVFTKQSDIIHVASILIHEWEHVKQNWQQAIVTGVVKFVTGDDLMEYVAYQEQINFLEAAHSQTEDHFQKNEIKTMIETYADKCIKESNIKPSYYTK